MDAREPLVVALAVEAHVELVSLLETDHHVVDVLHATGAFAHGLRGEVRVAARAIPVGEELGLEGDRQVELLGNAVEEEA